MYVHSLLFKFNSDEKQLTRLFISVFASGCTLSPTKDGRPLWWWVGLTTLCVQGSEWPSTSRVILCQWHSTILTTNNCTILFWLLSSHLHRFQVIECDVYLGVSFFTIFEIQNAWGAVRWGFR